MLKIAVFISGSGTNLQSIIDNCESGRVNAEVVLVLSNEPDAYGIERAKKHNIPAIVVNHRDYASRKEFEDTVLKSISDYEIDLICLAGFMRVLTNNFLARFPNRIINIHPALLPSFAGTQGQQDAFDYGVKFTGCTVHFVDADVDTGPIIIQAVVPLKQDDTVETLKKRILAQEHKIYPQAIQYIAKGAVKIVGRKVVIKDLGDINDFAEINPPASIFD
ncbi:MAG: phosphoribosylglycinamide formyltransferase [Deltaproteobacteria bacterium]|uniref:Phosphoribosylglycinamide formyltransferase n=1 Tax=Candidatus Zymogenus saltonus TaxID=2844893 RepID=A0A9D8KDL7_9DELT|nr:phosphoribosylglycinamide formyltransferase [Candidatus Zymogenus saltonus]